MQQGPPCAEPPPRVVCGDGLRCGGCPVPGSRRGRCRAQHRVAYGGCVQQLVTVDRRTSPGPGLEALWQMRLASAEVSRRSPGAPCTWWMADPDGALVHYA